MHLPGVTKERKFSSGGHNLGATPFTSSEEPKTLPVFIQKLFIILKSESNSSIIEWKSNKIYIHDPTALCKEILPRYFRHSNLSSFARQLNYFSFRKIEGKGRMNPCVYGCDKLHGKGIDGILNLKRKGSVGKDISSGEIIPPKGFHECLVGFRNQVCLEVNPLNPYQQHKQGAAIAQPCPPYTQQCPSTSETPLLKGAQACFQQSQLPIVSFLTSYPVVNQKTNALISSDLFAQQINPLQTDNITIRNSKQVLMKEEEEQFLNQEDLHMLMNL